MRISSEGLARKTQTAEKICFCQVLFDESTSKINGAHIPLGKKINVDARIYNCHTKNTVFTLILHCLGVYQSNTIFVSPVSFKL